MTDKVGREQRINMIKTTNRMRANTGASDKTSQHKLKAELLRQEAAIRKREYKLIFEIHKLIKAESKKLFKWGDTTEGLKKTRIVIKNLMELHEIKNALNVCI